MVYKLLMTHMFDHSLSSSIMQTSFMLLLVHLLMLPNFHMSPADLMVLVFIHLHYILLYVYNLPIVPSLLPLILMVHKLFMLHMFDHSLNSSIMQMSFMILLVHLLMLLNFHMPPSDLMVLAFLHLHYILLYDYMLTIVQS